MITYQKKKKKKSNYDAFPFFFIYIVNALPTNSLNELNTIFKGKKIFSIVYAPIYLEMFFIFAACERLILLDTDAKELRDYSILLYHCGFFEESLQYLKLYQDTKVQFSIFIA